VLKVLLVVQVAPVLRVSKVLLVLKEFKVL